MHTLFKDRLCSLGIEKDINKTRFKEQLLAHFSGVCQEQSDGKTPCLFLMMDCRNCSRIQFPTVIFNCKPFQFSGEFPLKCQENSIPTTLTTFISMLLNGPDVQLQDNQESQACLTISQLVCFNIKSRRPSSESHWHFKDRQTPLPLYIGLNIHTQTRSKKILNGLHKLGSY